MTKNKKSPQNEGFSIGADDEIRTRDLNLGKVALYQLSYICLFQELLKVDLFILYFVKRCKYTSVLRYLASF